MRNAEACLYGAGCFLRVPQRLLLHEGTAYADAEFGAAFRALRAKAGAALDRRLVLCLLLLLERARGAASAWAPFLRVLPASYGAAPRPGHPFANMSTMRGSACPGMALLYTC